jgi:hypothetical protein
LPREHVNVSQDAWEVQQRSLFDAIVPYFAVSLNLCVRVPYFALSLNLYARQDTEAPRHLVVSSWQHVLSSVALHVAPAQYRLAALHFSLLPADGHVYVEHFILAVQQFWRAVLLATIFVPLVASLNLVVPQLTAVV